MTELEKLIQKIDHHQKEIDAKWNLNDELIKKIQYAFRLEMNYHSNKMEGNTLTKAETRSVMVGNITISGKPIKDVFEMKGHDDVLLSILKIGKGELRISEQRIKEIHAAIMYEDDLEKRKLIGNWKILPNEMMNYRGEKFLFVLPGQVHECMHDLLNKTNALLDEFWVYKKKDKAIKIHPLWIASDFHLNYLNIHPFYDGNGRTARILSNLILIACGFPPIFIDEIQKETYYKYLTDIQGYGGDRELFHHFMADRMLASQQMVLDGLGSN